jgi:GDP-L-fucose synthase
MERRVWVMKILICGATGFIGRNIAERFLTAYPSAEIIGVYNQRPPFDLHGLAWVQADLTNSEDATRIMVGIDIVVQAAATTSGSKDIVSRPFIHVTDNAVMNSLLLRAAYECKIKHFIFFSCTVMLQSSQTALKEDDFDANVELHPRYFGVGWTKVYVEKMCEFYSRLGATKFTCIRHSNVYGPHDKFDLEKSHVFGATVTKVMRAQDTITVWGTGEEERDLLYVEDLVDFVYLAIEKQNANFEVYNVGYGEATSIKALVSKIVRASGKALKVEHDLSQPSIKTSLFLDCSKAKAQLGWESRTSIEDGIRKTLNWWRENPPTFEL